MLIGCQDTDTIAAQQDAYFGIAERALILVMDGTRIEETLGDAQSWGEGWSDAAGGRTHELMPRLRAQLLPQGAWVRQGYATGLTVTVPAHADLVTGARERYPHLGAGEGAGYYRPLRPTLFEQLARERGLAAGSTVLMGNTVMLTGLDWSLFPGLGPDLAAEHRIIYDRQDPGALGESDAQVVQQAAAHMQLGAQLVLANLHHVDLMGHSHPEIYHGQVTALDEPIVELWDWIHSEGSGLAERTLLMVISDHGRHRFVDGETPWQHHGCYCSGCREVPMLLLGPGVRRNAVLSGPHLLEDITQTAAWLLGVPMPHGTGLVMEDALQGAGQPQQRSGPADLAASGDLLAWQRWTAGLDNRSELVVGDSVFEDAAAIHMESPQVLRGAAADYACWRQLSLGTTDEIWPWEGRCAMDDGSGWQQIGFPVEHVSPYVEPELFQQRQGQLLLAFTDFDPQAELSSDDGSDSLLRLASWSAARGWQLPEGGYGQGQYPTGAAAAADEGEILLACGLGESETDVRYTRHIEILRIAWPEHGEQTWTQAAVFDQSDDRGQRYERLDHPALLLREEEGRMACHGMGGEGVTVLMAQRQDDDTWSALQALDDSGLVFPHVPPAWSSQGELYWSRLGLDGLAQVCRWRGGDKEPDCQSADMAHLDSLAPFQDGVSASVHDGDMQWELVQLTW